MRQLIAAVLLAACVLGSTARAQQNVVIIFDDSGSMDDRMQGGERRIDAAKRALTSVLDSLPAETNVGVLALNSSANGSNWIIPLGPLTTADWRQNVARLQAVGGTPLGEYLKVGADALLEARAEQVYGEFRLLVISDGEANDQWLVDDYLPQILARGLRVEAIGVDMAGDHSLATEVHAYRRADDDVSLERAISEVFAETSPDDQDASDSFEMLEGLPDGFADEAIAALTEVSNAPIENNGGRPSRGSSTATAGDVVSGVAAFLGFGCVCFGGFIGLVILVLLLTKAGRRNR